MAPIDLILNVACVLFWFNWRSGRLSTLGKTPLVSLAATLKKAEPHRSGRWWSLLGVPLILGGRSVFYWHIGSNWNWTPTLELGVVSLPFRSDHLFRAGLFSLLSFGLLLATIYAWLLLLSLINRSVSNEEPFQRLVRMHLGAIDRWPALVKLVLPFLLSGLVWSLAHPGLVEIGIAPPVLSKAHLGQQAVLLGLASYLVWKPFVLVLCLLFLINSYVHLGQAHFWAFVNTTGRNFLWLLRRFPICIGRLDFSPLVMIVLVLAAGHWASRGLPLLFQRLPL